MIKPLLFLLTASLLLFSSTLFAATPVGFWQQISDQTHEPQAIIHITQAKDGLQGVILAAYKKAQKQKECSTCQGESTLGNKKNAPMLGLTILKNLTLQKTNTWGNGEIFDPHSGKVYHCEVVLSEDGLTLKVTGYMGSIFFGRTQTWRRLTTDELKQLKNHTS